MKVIKIIFLAAVMLGVVFGISQLAPLISGPQTETPAELDNPLFKKIEEDIKDKWSTNAKWDSEGYEYLKAYITTYRTDERIGVVGYRLLRNTNAQLATDVLHKTLMDEYARADCDSATVATLTNMAYALKDDVDNQLEDNVKIKECFETYTLYTVVLSFGNKTHTLTPQFNKSSGTFNSLSKHEDRVRGERDKYKAHEHYAKIANSNDIKAAINGVDQKLASVRSEYPGQVYNAIVWAYKNAKYTNDNLNSLKRAVNNYTSEFGSNPGLDSFFKVFKSNVEEANKRNESPIH